MLSSGLIKPGRWQKTLSEVARASQVHAAVIQLALQACFSGSAKEQPKDSSRLLELLYELSLEFEVPVTNELCKAWLASGEMTGKSAKLAKSLLALSESSESKVAIQALLEQAIFQRILAAKD